MYPVRAERQGIEPSTRRLATVFKTVCTPRARPSKDTILSAKLPARIHWPTRTQTPTCICLRMMFYHLNYPSILSQVGIRTPIFILVDGAGIEPALPRCKRGGQPLTIPSMYLDCTIPARSSQPGRSQLPALDEKLSLTKQLAVKAGALYVDIV